MTTGTQASPWKMVADLMQNTGSSGFLRCNADNLGGYGETGVLGRAMARVDWNRDGLPDAVITHLDRSPALLENRTRTNHHSLSLRLTGTISNRSAVGAIITVSLGRSGFGGSVCRRRWILLLKR